MLAHQDGFPLADTNLYLCFYKRKGFEIHYMLIMKASDELK